MVIHLDLFIFSNAICLFDWNDRLKFIYMEQVNVFYVLVSTHNIQ